MNDKKKFEKTQRIFSERVNASDTDRYRAACHAMQTGVATETEYDDFSIVPKHLRVGVNTAMCDHAALVRLLVSKGVITYDEYFKETADEMEREVERYKTRINKHFGTDNITLQ
jgi:hypothetical protein